MALCKSSLWTIGSGKGGVGKSFLTACMGIALARSGRSVIMVDANLASPDLHGILGIKVPNVSLRNVIFEGASLSDALVSTPEPHMQFVSCAGDEFGVAGLAAEDQMQLLAQLRSLDADCVLVDAGTGMAPALLDSLNAAHQAIIVTSPDPAAMRCTFRLMRHLIFRRVAEKYREQPDVVAAMERLNPKSGMTRSPIMADFLALLSSLSPQIASEIHSMVQEWQPVLLVNMADSEQDQRIAEIIRSAVKKILTVDFAFGGLISFDCTLRRTAPRALDFSENGCAAAKQIRQIALRLGESPAKCKPEETHFSAALSPVMGLNDNLTLMGREIHIQTEDLGASAHHIATQVFCDGRVLLSTKSEYPSSLRDPLHNTRLVELMRNQHFSIIRQIENRQTKAPPYLAENS